MVIKLPIGHFEIRISVFSIGNCRFRIEDWRKNMGKTPIPNSKSPIGFFHHLLVISTFSSLVKDKAQYKIEQEIFSFQLKPW